MIELKRSLGAIYHRGQGTSFKVWAPKANKVRLHIVSPFDQWFEFEELASGYYQSFVEEAGPGTRYFFELDGKEYPDPTSRFQPEGVHGPSEVVDSRFAWTDKQRPEIDLNDQVIYELHVGTFTEAGTFEGVIDQLPRLRELGVTTLEIMPVAQFPGHRNWGYDGVNLYAVQNSYGGPQGLKNLVNRCHQEGFAVILDVVYNHLGPEGNYLPLFGHYFQDRYHTPWGSAVNFDGEWSDEVRQFFFENVIQWLDEYHFDGLRLDAIHAIMDESAKPFLEELSELKEALEGKLGRTLLIIGETDANDSRVVRPRSHNGLGLDGQWNDDFHHALHAYLTGEDQGYYAAFGAAEHIAEAYQNGVIYQGQYSAFRKRRFGRSYEGVDRRRLVVCSQNHDQVGNRARGERLTSLVGFKRLKAAAAATLLSPFMPLLFMGEEFAEPAPFLYFVDHGDENLREAVRKGRKEEFGHFFGDQEPPDPCSDETFRASRIEPLRVEKEAAALSINEFYKALIEQSKWLRKTSAFHNEDYEVKYHAHLNVIEQRGKVQGEPVIALLSLNDKAQGLVLESEANAYEVVLDSSWYQESQSSVPEQPNILASTDIKLEPFGAILLRGKYE